MKKFDAIIPFCSEDSIYIQPCIDNLRGVANKIIITYWNKMFDGSDENFDIINNIINNNKDIKFININFEPKQDKMWYYCHSRYIGYLESSEESEYILLLDSDEIFEKNKFVEWIKNTNEFNAAYFANYWYFRDKKYQAKNYEDSPVMINKKFIKKENFYNSSDRRIYITMQDSKIYRYVLGLDGLPMCHHYSWVLSKEKMIKKIMRSAHENDKDWMPLIDKEFSRDFNGTDFVHGYSYNILEKSYI
jgi:hypothetical protein